MSRGRANHAESEWLSSFVTPLDMQPPQRLRPDPNGKVDRLFSMRDSTADLERGCVVTDHVVTGNDWIETVPAELMEVFEKFDAELHGVRK